MKTEHMLAGDEARRIDRVGALLQGTIFAAEFDAAGFGAAGTATGAEDAPEATKEKTCKPTRNPCCHEEPEGTKAKTCKPTRNPCCREDEDEPAAETRHALDLLVI
ncbi:hypothetical protein ACFOKI_01215 [Sphingomonas qilianensis]|uniref:Uncharacterized protein n=1 Tax=Sphingomonas qilianensis TaxID=1736690 RepID=A0ABU9XTE1_9SPHN